MLLAALRLGTTASLPRNEICHFMFDVEEYIEITLIESDYRFDGTIHMRDARNLLIACPPEAASHLKSGMPLQLAQLIGDNVYQIDTTILRCQQNYCVVEARPPQLVHHRRSPRHACVISATYRLQAMLNSHPEEAPVAAKEGCIRDISQGGMKLVTGEAVPAGTRLVVEATLREAATVVLPAEALHCKQLLSPSAEPSNVPEYQISCRFINLAQADEMELDRYLMNQSA